MVDRVALLQFFFDRSLPLEVMHHYYYHIKVVVPLLEVALSHHFAFVIQHLLLSILFLSHRLLLLLEMVRKSV